MDFISYTFFCENSNEFREKSIVNFLLSAQYGGHGGVNYYPHTQTLAHHGQGFASIILLRNFFMEWGCCQKRRFVE